MLLTVEFGTLNINVTVTIKNEMQEADLIEKVKALEAQLQSDTDRLKAATNQNQP